MTPLTFNADATTQCSQILIQPMDDCVLSGNGARSTIFFFIIWCSACHVRNVLYTFLLQVEYGDGEYYNRSETLSTSRGAECLRLNVKS